MASIFTKIHQPKKIPAEIIAEDADFIAFLDIMAFGQEGTWLVVQKGKWLYFHLDRRLDKVTFYFAQKVAKVMDRAVNVLE